MPSREILVSALRYISDALADSDIEVVFEKNDCPFVDRACEAIEHGGTVDATSLSSLVFYIAEMLEE